MAQDRSSRAIAGLSMGGTESLPHRFKHNRSIRLGTRLGSGESGETSTPRLPHTGCKGWLAASFALDCLRHGKIVSIEPNRKLAAMANVEGRQAHRHRNVGAAAWMVWRRNLATYLPGCCSNEPRGTGAVTRGVLLRTEPKC